MKNVKKIIVEKKSAINFDDSEAIDQDDSINSKLLNDRSDEIKDPKKLTKDLDDDEEYESRKGVASVFQKIFRGKRSNK
jgi:hypothetical protein